MYAGHMPSTPFQSTRPIRGATKGKAQTIGTLIFQSTRPIRGATAGTSVIRYCTLNFNPHAPYGARLFMHTLEPFQAKISIHTPHTGRDGCGGPVSWRCGNFNPHAPYGARRSRRAPPGRSTNFNPHAPYGARLATPPQTPPLSSDFNPHAPYGARLMDKAREVNPTLFQSTRPIRGATRTREKLLTAVIFQSTRPIRGATSVGYG